MNDWKTGAERHPLTAREVKPLEAHYNINIIYIYKYLIK